MTITTIIYDIGNVLIGWDPRRVWRRVLTEREIEDLLQASDFHRLNLELDAGRPFVEVHAELGRIDPRHAEFLQYYWENFEDSLIPGEPEAHAVLEGLTRMGYRMLGLSNWSAETFHHARAHVPVLRHLEEIIVSGEVGLIKPDPRIFHHLIAVLEVTPANTVFIDDSAPNIDTARRLGFAALHYTHAANLKAQLAELGIRVD